LIFLLLEDEALRAFQDYYSAFGTLFQNFFAISVCAILLIIKMACKVLFKILNLTLHAIA